MLSQSRLRPGRPAIFGVLMCVPVLALILLASNNIVPPFAAPDPTGQVGLAARVVMLIALFASLLGFLVNVRDAWRGDRASQVAAVVALAVTVALVTFAVVDQWDCFRGVPNCD